MSLIAFEIWISRLARIFLITGPMQVIMGITLFPYDRVFIVSSGVIVFCIGFILRYASSKFRETPRSSIMLVEKVFYYVFAPVYFLSFIYQCLTNKELIESTFGVMFAAIDLLLGIGGLFFIRKIINDVKRLAQ